MITGQYIATMVGDAVLEIQEGAVHTAGAHTSTDAVRFPF